MISSKLQMRRFENGTRDPKMIAAILDQVKIVHVGCFDEGYPYVVPLSFGYEIKDDKLLVYLHGALEGHKVDLWQKNPHVALTFSMFSNYPDRKYKGCMHDFRSVMALGIISSIDRSTMPKMNGTAVQSMLKHNDRRSNQFNVSHYMWMGVYVVTCSMEDVVGKFENPIENPSEVPFPDVYHIPENHEPYDYHYFYHRKPYTKVKNFWTTVDKSLPHLNENDCISVNSSEIDITFNWNLRKDSLDADLDISALMLNREGRVSRRYDMSFYNQATDRSNTVSHKGDDISGEVAGQETLHIRLDSAPDYLSSILVNLSRFQAELGDRGISVIEALQMSITNCEDNSLLADFLLDIPNGDVPAASLILLKKSENGWEVQRQLRSYASWKILDQSAEHGLVKWKE